MGSQARLSCRWTGAVQRALCSSRGETAAVPRLRRSNPARSGWTRRRSGKGFVFLDQNGQRLGNPEDVQRLRDLVIPPAWENLWLSPYPNGHIQAIGTDAAGRRQYIYHEQWTQQRAVAKHAHMTEFARRLPGARTIVQEHLGLPGMPRERALAAAFRLLDLGLFRVGGESYAEENGSFGLATLRKEHLRISRGGAMQFEYVAKSGQHRKIAIEDDHVLPVIQQLRRRRTGQELLAYQSLRRWADVSSADINSYVKQVVSADASAKDFRTWHATVLAAVALSGRPQPGSAAAAKRAVSQAMREVSEYLGNTPTVCRASYVDPRVLDRFAEGITISTALRRAKPGTQNHPTGDTAIEKAVLRLLNGKH